MAQHDYVIANQSGAAFRADLNNALAAIVSQNSGAAEPSTTYAYMPWADMTNGLFKIRNAANSAWITLYQLDGEWDTIALEDGTALAPSLYFKDSGTDTGIYSPAADNFAITTVGVERVNFKGATEVVFNDGGADVDFRIEGDTEPNLFKVDAGTDQVQVANLNGGQLAGHRNRIINGDMRIDQRNAGVSVTIINSLTGGTYTLDRFLVNAFGGGGIDVQQVTDAPAGFNNSIKCTVSTADTNIQNVNPPSIPSNEEYFIQQMIEGYNCADFGFGTANAKTVTINFWVKASLAGSYGFALKNSGVTRSYPTSYAISAGEVNTWVKRTITIAGDTSGTWNKIDGMGFEVHFSLGAAPAAKGTANTWAAANYSASTGSLNWISTNGATFYITGVQLELGTVATPFEYRNYAAELAMCQRYYSVLDNVSTFPVVSSIGAARGFFKFPTTMRSASPSCTFAYDLGSGATWAIGSNGGYQNGNHSATSGFSVKASAEFI